MHLKLSKQMIILNLLRFIQFSKLIYVIGSVAADEAVEESSDFDVVVT